ncbi:MAG: class I SAM-dependent methyltransferase [Polyangiaceae bacterium]|nr:class I SAM-dependent methyltransferase [Polyangiaceae bacterium]
MNTPSAPVMPDFNRMAASFDRYLPQVHPVTLALLDHLPALAAGAEVLDVACGTGEPGLTLARRSPDVHVLGVDSAPAMIEVARSKVAGEALGNARFEVMSSEALALGDESVDAVISRFGVMMFGDVRASARELARVLRRGGHFSLAVWDDMTRNTLVYSLTMVLAKHLPEGHVSPLHRLNEWAGDGLRARLLEHVGLAAVRSEMFDWMYTFNSFEEPWDLVHRMGMITGQANLSPEAQEQVKADLLEALSIYRQPSGGYQIPHACRLIWGRR